MRILLVHNEYKEYGGEDVAVSSEESILLAQGHDVRKVIFANASVSPGPLGLIQYVFSLPFNLRSARRISREIASFRPDVMHVHNLFYVASPSVIIRASKLGIPVVMTLHNYRIICSGGLLIRSGKICERCIKSRFPFSGVLHRCHQNSLFGSFYLTLSMGFHKSMSTWKNHVSLFITMTEFIKQKFIHSSMGVPPENFVIKANSVTDQGMGPPEGRSNRFLFVGRLTTEKGVELLSTAFKKNSYELDVIGDGPKRLAVQELCRQNCRVNYLGFLSRDEISNRLKNAKALIVPSLWYEGLPTTILEAFSTGTPIIVSDIGNLNEIVTHGFNGLCFDPKRVDSLNETLDVILQNPEIHASLCKNARLTYLQKYTPEINGRNLEKIYLMAKAKKGIKVK